MTLQISMDWLAGGCHWPDVFPGHNLGSTAEPEAIHPACTNLKLLWDLGMVAFISCTGPEAADGSHFNMTRVQQDTGNYLDGMTGVGWANKSLQLTFPDGKSVLGIAVGDSVLPRVLQGAAPAAAVQSNVSGLDGTAMQGLIAEAASASDLNEFLRDQFIFEMAIATQIAGFDLAYTSRGRTVAETFAETPSVKFVYSSGGGFDTHTKHDAQLATSLSIWDAGLGEYARARGWLPRPDGDGERDDLPLLESDALHVVGTDFSRDLILTSGGGYSHGRGGGILVIGPRVKGGFHGPPMPTLAVPERLWGAPNPRFLPVDVLSNRVWLTVLQEAGWVTDGVFVRDYDPLPGLFTQSAAEQVPEPRPEAEPMPEPEPEPSRRTMIIADMRSLLNELESLV